MRFFKRARKRGKARGRHTVLREVWTSDGSLLPPEPFEPMQGPPKSGADKETVLRKIAEVSFWFHHIEMGHGIVTPGHQGSEDDPGTSRRLIQMLDMPADLSGKTVLDIGAWDGLFSFEAERRNAARVLATDNFCRFDEASALGSSGFNVAKEILASNVEFQERDVYDLSPETVGTFDVVLFLGVLYHLRHPLLALERIASVTKEMAIIESQFTQEYDDRPVACFYENDELANDPTNWWVPNQSCIEAMIRSAGFRSTEHVCNSPSRIVIKAYK